MTALAHVTPTDPAAPPPIVCFRAGRVINVLFTGVTPRCASRWRTLFNPPLEAALATIVGDLGRDPHSVSLAHARPEKEPESLRRAVVVLSSGEGEGKWPLAYLTAENEPLTLAECEEALAALRRRWPA